MTEVDDLAFAIGAGLASGMDPNSIAQHLVEAGWRPAGKKSMPVFAAVAFIGLVVGGVASLLLWDWRWVVIGVGLVLVVSAVGAALDGRAK